MKRHTLRTIYLVLVVLSLVLEVLGKECNSKDLCSCIFDGGAIMDITSLGNNDNTPRFSKVKGTDGNLYSYNPCKPFSEGSCTTDAAACVLYPTLNASEQIGDSSRATFKYDDETGHVVVGYTSGYFTDLRVTQVLLQCDRSACDPQFTAQGDISGGEYQFSIRTVCACPNGCSPLGPISCSTSGVAGGISGRSILLIAIVFQVVKNNLIK